MGAERRQQKRFRAVSTIPVGFTCADRLMDGRLYDISTQGLAIEYEGSNALDFGKSLDITIFGNTADGVIVKKLPCTPVYDIPTLDRRRTFSGKMMRLCGMVCATTSQNMLPVALECLKDELLEDEIEL